MLVPLRAFEPALWTRRTHIDRTIVEVETDDGLVGLGETRALWAAKIVEERFAPALIGLDARDRAGAKARCLRHKFDYGFPEQLLDVTAFAGIELALWDLAGKAAGLPLFRLLGGPVRERAHFCAYGYPPDPSGGVAEAEVPRLMATLAQESVARTGASLFEFKIARHGLDCDIRTTHAVRDALGDGVEIAVDPNMAYDLGQARRYLTETATARLTNIEEPVAALPQMVELQSDFGIPISTHCTLLDSLSAYPSVVGVVFDLHAKGGIGPTLDFIAEVSALGRQVWLRAAWELGVSFAAMCHLAMAAPELERPSQALMQFPTDDLILGAPWRMSDGGCRPPDSPGLGVDLDRQALQLYCVS
ncbi:MAG: mandelate racemase/muconate lactonizing enzyme family protein [Rhodospirillales bacterium]